MRPRGGRSDGALQRIHLLKRETDGRFLGTGPPVDYTSSYADGATPPMPNAGAYASASIDAAPGTAANVHPAPRPIRIHWSTIVLVSGLTICLFGLIATIAGVPARLWYDVDGSPSRNKPDSNDPMAMTRSLDQNMKWIDENSGDAKGGYVGYIKSINRNEAAIVVMVQALVTMDRSVKAIDAGLGVLNETTSAIEDDLDEMNAASAASAATMSELSTDIGFLSESMLGLASSTQQLTKRMAAIEKKAGGISENGTSAALANTKALNASLPSEVPVPTTTDGEPLDQAMKRLASGGGGTQAVAQ